MKAALRLLLTFLAPGVVLLLVGIQVAYGLRGFDDPRGGIATVLEVPGLLVGWGSMAFLVPLLVWLVLDWWGLSAPGLALKCLGAATFALAAGAILGVTGGVVAGGHVGAALAELLTGALGSGLSIVLLAVMAVPGLILMSAGFRNRSGAPKAAPAKRPRDPGTKAPAKQDQPRSRGFGFKRRKRVTNLADLVRDEPDQEREPGEAWYPQPEYDESGNELPMRFGARDVGEIRYLATEDDEVENTADVEAEAEVEVEVEAEAEAPSTDDVSEPKTGLPTIPELFAGDFDADALDDRLASEDGAQPESATNPGPAAAPEPDVDPDVDPDDPNVRVHVDGAGNERLSVTPVERVVTDLGRVADSAGSDELLSADVRWAEPSPEPEAEPEDAAPAAELGDDGVELPEPDPLHDVMRRPSIAHEAAEQPETPSVRDSVRDALDGEAHSASSQRYREKLESSGIFDFMEADETDEENGRAKTSSSSKRTPKKKAAKKKVAKKKVAKKKKVAARKKKAVKKRGTSASAPQTRNAPAPKTKPARQKPGDPTATRVRADVDGPDRRRPPRANSWRTDTWRGGAPTANAPRLDPEAEIRTRLLLRERLDPRFAKAARICVDRGAASAVLLTRRLGLGFSEAKTLVERLLAAGVLGPATRTGSHPALLTPEAWDALRRRPWSD